MFGGMITNTNNTLTNEDEGAPLDERDEATFPPPDEPIKVVCLHCHKEYMSSEMVFRRGAPGEPMSRGFWWCATPGCHVGGFGLDIFPVDTSWKDPKGLLEFIETDEDAFVFDDEIDEEDDEPDDEDNEDENSLIAATPDEPTWLDLLDPPSEQSSEADHAGS
jgi:hypothetical protein